MSTYTHCVPPSTPACSATIPCSERHLIWPYWRDYRVTVTNLASDMKPDMRQTHEEHVENSGTQGKIPGTGTRRLRSWPQRRKQRTSGILRDSFSEDLSTLRVSCRQVYSQDYRLQTTDEVEKFGFNCNTPNWGILSDHQTKYQEKDTWKKNLITRLLYIQGYPT